MIGISGGFDMIDNLDDLQEAMYSISNDVTDTAHYENKMVSGLLMTWVVDENLGDDPFSIYDLSQAKVAYSNFKSWAHNQISRMIAALNEIRDDYVDSGEYENEEDAEDSAAEAAKDYILSWSISSKESGSLNRALKEGGFTLIRSYSELAEQLNEYMDFSDWDDAFDSHMDEFPQRIVGEVFE